MPLESEEYWRTLAGEFQASQRAYPETKAVYRGAGHFELEGTPEGMRDFTRLSEKACKGLGYIAEGEKAVDFWIARMIKIGVLPSPW